MRGFGRARTTGLGCSLEAGAGRFALRSFSPAASTDRVFPVGTSITNSGLRGEIGRRSRGWTSPTGVKVRFRVTTGRRIISPGGTTTLRGVLPLSGSIVGAAVAGVLAISGNPARAPLRIQSDTSVSGADGRVRERSDLLKPSIGTTVTPRAGGLIPILPSPGRWEPLRTAGYWRCEWSPPRSCRSCLRHRSPGASGYQPT